MNVSPQDFDFDAWLDGAERPERAVTVYQKAGLLAELDRIEEQITTAELDEGEIAEFSIGQVSEARRLRDEYAEVAKRFHDSALAVRVQALTREEQRDLVEGNKGLTPTEIGYIVLAEAIAFPKCSPDQLRKLERVLGDAQFGRIMTAFHQASNEMPEVSADFLPKRSTSGDGGE